MQTLLTRPQASRLLTRCRATEPIHTATAVVERKPEEPEKITATISSLDALLGEQAKPQAPTPAPAKPAAPAATSSSQQPAFNWPSQQTKKPLSAAEQRAQQKAQQTFETLMAFEGLAPEVINGRAAMLGFLFAMGGELGRGESVYAQVVGGGLGPALGIIALVTLASFAPGLRQVPWEEVFNKPKKEKDIKNFGPFTADAERINGRWAMIALGIMILLEGPSGTSFLLG